MFFAVAFLLIQPQVAPHISLSAKEIAIIQPASASPSPNTLSSDNTSPTELALASLPRDVEASVAPAAPAEVAALPSAPEPIAADVPMAFLKVAKPGTISVNELRAEQRRKDRVWMALGIADHTAATFDAWTTRYAIGHYGAQELNPTLRPFAGNASLYAAIQVGPALMDFVGKKMMYSRHPLVRRLWWIPQSASFASSLFCGAHNIAVR
jgi:hypothetical protein